MEEKINNYFSNLLSEDEKQQLFDELDKNEELQKEFTDELNTLSLVMMQEKEGDLLYARHKLKAFKLKTRKVLLRKISFQLVRYAAVILLTLGCFSLYQYYKRNNTSAIEYASFEVPNGQQAKLSLPDNTVVWLNAGTKLRYPSDFSTKNRHVHLDGEGYFEVTSDKKNPFVIQTSLMAVKVLGTKFNIKSYEEEEAHVSLMEGKVEIATPDGLNKLTLNPNEQVSVSGTNGISLTRQKNTDGIKLWTSGGFSYVNEPLFSITKDLERRYDVKITILDKELSEELFSTKSTEKETIEQILDRLKDTRELYYVIERKNIKIYKHKKKMPME